MLTRKTGLYFYDGKKLWEIYMGMGKAATYRKLRDWCLTNGMTNPQTGGVSSMGPVWAMWRYAIQNPEEAFEAYKQWQFEYGNFPTFRDFCEDVYDHANTTKSTVTNEDDKKEFKKKYLPEITEVVNEKDSVAV